MRSLLLASDFTFPVTLFISSGFAFFFGGLASLTAQALERRDHIRHDILEIKLVLNFQQFVDKMGKRSLFLKAPETEF